MRFVVSKDSVLKCLEKKSFLHKASYYFDRVEIGETTRKLPDGRLVIIPRHFRKVRKRVPEIEIPPRQISPTQQLAVEHATPPAPPPAKRTRRGPRPIPGQLSLFPSIVPSQPTSEAPKRTRTIRPLVEVTKRPIKRKRRVPAQAPSQLSLFEWAEEAALQTNLLYEERKKAREKMSPRKRKEADAEEIKERYSRGKKPYEMSQVEWKQNTDRPPEEHKEKVEDAIKEGEDVPPHVVRDYPDLAKIKPVQTEAPVTEEVSTKIDQQLGEAFGIDTASVKERVRLNNAAREILKQKKTEYSPEEIDILRQYSGRGGTDDKHLNEFYTPPETAKAVWAALQANGFKGGAVLEPSCATGVFIHTKPKDTHVTGIEIDPISASIANLLHTTTGKDNEILNMPLEHFARDESRNDSFDAVIGNIPFGQRGRTKSHHKGKFNDNGIYFIDTSIDLVKPGGLVAVISSESVLNATRNKKHRVAISKKAEFLGAYKLPSDTFKRAGTPAVTDILIFRKHPKGTAEKISHATTEQLEQAGILDNEFIQGGYWQGRGAGNMQGGSYTPAEKGRFGTRSQLSSTLSPEEIIKNVSKPLQGKADYSKLGIVSPQTEANKLNVGDHRMINGRMYVLNENHRWERVEEEEPPPVRAEELFDGLDHDIIKSRMSDLSELINMPLDYVEQAIKYLTPDSSSREGFDDARVGWTAVQNDGDSTSRAHLFEAFIIGRAILRLQEKRRNNIFIEPAEYQKIGLMLKDFQMRHGNPATDRFIKKESAKYADLVPLVGAFKADGTLSDQVLGIQTKDMEKGEYNSKDIYSTLSYLYTKDGAASLEEIQRAYDGDEEITPERLLADDQIAYVDDRYLPMHLFLTGEVYEKADSLLLAADKEENEVIRNKLINQADRLIAAAPKSSIDDFKFSVQHNWIPRGVIKQYFQEQVGVAIDFDEGARKWHLTGYSLNFKPKSLVQRDALLLLNQEPLRSKKQKQWANAIEKDFNEWVPVSEHREDLEDLANRTFLGFVQPSYSGEEIPISNLKPEFKLHDYQYSNIRKMSEMGSGINAFDVGLGKTFTAIALTQHLKDQGRVTKPLVVCPLSVLSNWKKEADKLLKEETRVYVVGLDEFGRPVTDPVEKQRQLQEVAQNDYDLVIMHRDLFNSIPLSPELQSHYEDEKISRKIEKEVIPAGKKTFKEEEKKAKLAAKYGASGIVGEKSKLYFEDLGIDAIVVDEAHAYKNLYAPDRHSRLKGIPTKAAAARSVDMNWKTQYIRENNDGRNVFFLTATPTTNSPLEAYNMLSYIAPHEFRKMGIYDVDDFINIFTRTREQTVCKINGDYENEQVIAGFQNEDALRNIFMKYTDMRTANDVESSFKIPEARTNIHMIDLNEEQAELYEELRARAEAIMDGRSDEHIFSVMRDMEKATVDPDLYYNRETNSVAPKYAALAAHVKDSYDAGGKQLIFSEEKTQHEKIKKILINHGIPEDQIAIINADTAKSSRDRQAISNAYNSGKFRVIIANKTAEEGVNLQEGTTDIHHLTLPWTPASIQQRNGRGVRQGNEAAEVGVHYYLAKGSFDAKRLELIDRKKGWINELWRGNGVNLDNQNLEGAFSSEETRILIAKDPDAAAAKFEEAKKKAASNITAQKKAQAAKDLEKYLKLSQSYNALTPEKQKRSALPQQIRRLRKLLETNDQFGHRDLLESPAKGMLTKEGDVRKVGQYLKDKETGSIFKVESVSPMEKKFMVSPAFTVGGRIMAIYLKDAETTNRFEPVSMSADEIESHKFRSTVKEYHQIFDYSPGVAAANMDHVQEKIRNNGLFVAPDGEITILSRYDKQDHGLKVYIPPSINDAISTAVKIRDRIFNDPKTQESLKMYAAKELVLRLSAKAGKAVPPIQQEKNPLELEAVSSETTHPGKIVSAGNQQFIITNKSKRMTSRELQDLESIHMLRLPGEGTNTHELRSKYDGSWEVKSIGAVLPLYQGTAETNPVYNVQTEKKEPPKRPEGTVNLRKKLEEHSAYYQGGVRVSKYKGKWTISPSDYLPKEEWTKAKIDLDRLIPEGSILHQGEDFATIHYKPSGSVFLEAQGKKQELSDYDIKALFNPKNDVEITPIAMAKVKAEGLRHIEEGHPKAEHHIKLSTSREGEKRIYVSSPYDPKYVSAFRNMPGRHWDPQTKRWSFPYSESAVKHIRDKIFSGKNITHEGFPRETEPAEGKPSVGQTVAKALKKAMGL